MDKIRVIIEKEWAEVFRNRMVLFTVAFLPLLMTAIPLGILFSMRGDSAMTEAGAAMPAQFEAFCPPNVTGGECMQVYLVSQFMIMFMIIPLAIPSSIAAYSIIGEKTSRSLEPLLATPITTAQLLIGKSLSALLPAVAATYLAFGLFVLGAWLIVPSPSLFAALLDIRWLLAVFLAGPLLALLSVNFSVMVSSRVNDPRVAEQLAAVIIVPVLALFFAQIGGLLVLNRNLVLLIALFLIVLDTLMSYLAVQLFQRETILTRWK
jgi:ABC-2 type transport system permease protein